MKISYANEYKRTMKYRRGKNHREWSTSSRRKTTIKLTKSGNRSGGKKIWGIILLIVKLALEIAVELVGSGKCHVGRLLPESVLYNEIYRQTYS